MDVSLNLPKRDGERERECVCMCERMKESKVKWKWEKILTRLLLKCAYMHNSVYIIKGETLLFIIFYSVVFGYVALLFGLVWVSLGSVLKFCWMSIDSILYVRLYSRLRLRSFVFLFFPLHSFTMTLFIFDVGSCSAFVVSLIFFRRFNTFFCSGSVFVRICLWWHKRDRECGSAWEPEKERDFVCVGPTYDSIVCTKSDCLNRLLTLTKRLKCK